MGDKVLIDTSALYAVVSPYDKVHLQANPLYENLVDREAEMYITSYALLETIAIVHRRLGFTTLKNLKDTVISGVRIFWIDQEKHNAAWENFASRNGAGPSLVDWTTILAARNLGASVFTFDSDFNSEGISVIPHQIGT